MADPLTDAFPTRPLRITAPFSRWKSWALALLGALCLGGGAAAISWAALPALLSDHEVRARAAPYSKASLVNGRCRVRLAVLHECDLKLAVATASGRVEREVNYFFVDAHSGSRAVVPYADPDRPELVTTDLGVERWTNRAITYAVAMVLMVGLALVCLGVPFVVGRQKRLAEAMSGQVLHPVPIGLTVAQGNWGVAPLGGGPKSGWNLGKGRPFLVNGVAVGVTAPGSPVFPLDEGLRWLDLTEEERTRIRAARDAMEGATPSGSA